MPVDAEVYLLFRRSFDGFRRHFDGYLCRFYRFRRSFDGYLYRFGGLFDIGGRSCDSSSFDSFGINTVCFGRVALPTNYLGGARHAG